MFMRVYLSHFAREAIPSLSRVFTGNGPSFLFNSIKFVLIKLKCRTAPEEFARCLLLRPRKRADSARACQRCRIDASGSSSASRRVALRCVTSRHVASALFAPRERHSSDSRCSTTTDRQCVPNARETPKFIESN